MAASHGAAGEVICTNEDVGINACGDSSDATQEAPSISNDVSNPKRSKDGTSSDDAGASHSQGQLYPSLSRDGPMYSKGSVQHDDGGCRPCSFYCFSQKGCFRGEECNFCHMFHSSKSYMKKDGRAQGYKISPGDRQHHAGESRISSGESDKSQHRKRVSFEVPETERSMSSSLPNGMQYPPAQDAAGSDSFSYLPSHVTAIIGQRLELVPLLDGVHPRVFATAPELPPGLMIDKYTGVIHGVPQEAYFGDIAGIYFVTCCELLADFKIRTASVHIQLPPAPTSSILASTSPNSFGALLGP